MFERSFTQLLRTSLVVISVATVPGNLFAEEAQSKPSKSVISNKPSKEAAKKLWGALIFASNDHEAVKANDFKKPSADLQKRLKKVFAKFGTFELLGQSSEALFKDTYSWVAPSKEFCMKFDSKGLTADGGYKLDLQLWSQDKAIVKTDAILKANSPVFIEGPAWGKGRLLFVVQLQEEKEK